MSNEIQKAIETLLDMVQVGMESSDALKVTQAALNLAHTSQVMQQGSTVSETSSVVTEKYAIVRFGFEADTQVYFAFSKDGAEATAAQLSEDGHRWDIYRNF